MSEPDGANGDRGLDPGWNDPPMFSYDSRPTLNSVKRPSLTKRVGLSWSSSSPMAARPRPEEPTVLPASAPPRGLPAGPPPPSCPSRPPQPFLCPTEPTPVTETVPSGELSEPRTINDESARTSLSQLTHQLFVGKEREKSEVLKRLSLLESAWNDGKLPDDVKEKLVKISEALQNGDVDGADKLQRGLMVDHSSLCSSWMAAVRKLISQKSESTSN